MKILVNKLPDTPEQCLFCIDSICIDSNRTFPSKCKLRLDNNDYGDPLMWTFVSHNNCALCEGEPCPYLQVLYGSASW
jgi:hypothetical protein